MGFYGIYPLVITSIAIENGNLYRVFPVIAWWIISIVMLNYQRISSKIEMKKMKVLKPRNKNLAEPIFRIATQWSSLGHAGTFYSVSITKQTCGLAQVSRFGDRAYGLHSPTTK